MHAQFLEKNKNKKYIYFLIIKWINNRDKKIIFGCSKLPSNNTDDGDTNKKNTAS